MDVTAQDKAGLTKMVALLCLSLVLVGCGKSTPSSSDTSPSASPFDCEGTYDDADELPNLSNTLEKEFGNRYADVRIDRSARPSILRVGVVNANAADQTTLDGISNMPDRVKVAAVKYSKSTLKQWKETIHPIARQHSSLAATGVRPSENKVVILVERPDSDLVPAILAKKIPADSFRVEITTVPKDLAGDPAVEQTPADENTCPT